MQTIRQSPVDPAFVQNPYPFYERARALGEIVFWQDYGLPVAVSYRAVNAILRDRRLGREMPSDRRTGIPPHLAGFHAVEAHSMLELEAPRHTRLRRLVLAAFTSRRIAGLEPQIRQLCHDLINAFPPGDFDLLNHYAARIPVQVICRLLGVPEAMADRLLGWSGAMVAMYQARRTRRIEEAADAAARDFRTFLQHHVDRHRTRPGDDLITGLIQAGQDGGKLSPDELIATCILLLNAGHEATAHILGNGVKAMLERGLGAEILGVGAVDRTIEEILRHDPPLHMFTRHVYEDVMFSGQHFRRGDRIGCLLAAANRDPQLFGHPAEFKPDRPVSPNASFGAGIHFCVGAPLARLELKVALPVLFGRCPDLRLTEPPRYANLYHFRGLERLLVGRRRTKLHRACHGPLR